MSMIRARPCSLMRRRDVVTLGLSCLAAGLPVPRAVLAQSAYPERPIRLVAPFAPGGFNDVIGRLWADKMKALLGPVYIENQGGGGGTVGGAAVARAQPDGYTIFLGGTASLVLVPATSPVSYDPAKDFEPISILVVTPLGIVVHPSVPARNLKELADYARMNPGKLSYGSAGVGTMGHLVGESFKSLAGTSDIVHLPYKGNALSISDLISGHIPMVILTIHGQLIELHRAGKLKMLAVTGPARAVAAPDVPTAVEAGWPGMVAQVFNGLFAPAGTSKAIVAQVADATRAAMADDEFRQRLIASGFEPYPDSSPHAARRFVDDEIVRWTPVIKAIGLKPE
jgi:tripartite-type tricarboxylate transporter receptor subunit TctC